MFLQVTNREYGDVTILDLDGALTLGSAATLREMIHELSVAGHRQLVLNLHDVTNLSNSAVDPLVAAARESALLGGEIKLAGIRVSPDDVLTIARLYAVFDVAEDDATAVCNFARPFASRRSEMFLG